VLRNADSNAAGFASTTETWGIPPFFVERGPHRSDADSFTFKAPTTARNALRVLRALQLRRSVLLEGSPGVGKTALVAALAKAAGKLTLFFSHACSTLLSAT
jgi:midasin (ATPase involved in ribosome maturation)